MLVMVAGRAMLVRAVPLKALSPMLVTAEPSVTLFRLEQLAKVLASTVFTASGRAMLFKLVQPWKALAPMLAILLPWANSTVSSAVQPSSIVPEMAVAPPPKVTFFKYFMLWNGCWLLA